MEREFVKHCRDNSLEGMNECLSNGVDVNTKEINSNWTGLMLACLSGSVEVLDLLLSRWADLSYCHAV